MPHKDPEKAKEYWRKRRQIQEHKDYQKEKRKQLLAINPRHRFDTNLRYLYGIGEEVYDNLYNKQNGCCAICNTHQSLLKRRLCVDHCHITKKIRGLLCHECNHGIGKLKDDKDILYRAAEYLLLAETNAIEPTKKPVKVGRPSKQTGLLEGQ